MLLCVHWTLNSLETDFLRGRRLGFISRLEIKLSQLTVSLDVVTFQKKICPIVVCA